eukprot:1156254-Pelagomonas_calceolata.AAC.5
MALLIKGDFPRSIEISGYVVLASLHKIDLAVFTKPLVAPGRLVEAGIVFLVVTKSRDKSPPYYGPEPTPPHPSNQPVLPDMWIPHDATKYPQRLPLIQLTVAPDASRGWVNDS